MNGFFTGISTELQDYTEIGDNEARSKSQVNLHINFAPSVQVGWACLKSLKC